MCPRAQRLSTSACGSSGSSSRRAVMRYVTLRGSCHASHLHMHIVVAAACSIRVCDCCVAAKKASSRFPPQVTSMFMCRNVDVLIPSYKLNGLRFCVVCCRSWVGWLLRVQKLPRRSLTHTCRQWLTTCAPWTTQCRTCWADTHDARLGLKKHIAAAPLTVAWACPMQ